MPNYHTIILGLGAMGSAATYQLAKRGVNVLGIDQFAPPHDLGSTHGKTRITRLAIGEGAFYSPLALRSHTLWREIENETGQNLLSEMGGLIISSDASTSQTHVENFFANTLAAAQQFGISHEMLDAQQIRQRFPQFKVRDDEVGYFEHQMGFVRPENCVHAQLALAQKCGAELHAHEKVVGFSQKNGVVRVQTDRAEYTAEKLIVSAGPWLPTLLHNEYAKHFTITRQTLFWFGVKGDIEKFESPHFPTFIWALQNQAQGIYGFPAINGQSGGIKIATESTEVTSADAPCREVSRQEIETMYANLVAPYFPDVSSNCIKAVSCLYTQTKDSHFLIDTHPEFSNVILVSPCSGHGFKHSAAIGEALAQKIVDGESDCDLSAFGLQRLSSFGPIF